MYVLRGAYWPLNIW